MAGLRKSPGLMASLIAGLMLGGCTGQPTEAEYAGYAAALVAAGDLRAEAAPADAAFTNADLVRNFERIALAHEVDVEQGGSDSNAAANPLKRWADPVRYQLYGSAVTPNDRIETADLFSRISRLTGLPAEAARDDVNFAVLITNPGERDEFSAQLAEINPDLAASFDLWRGSKRVVCLASTLRDPERDGQIVFAIVTIGAEVQGLLRTSCLHEEIVQAFGLSNDHPDVRPSIFNDDEEFALLTEHDEYLLRILYDPALKPGMTVDQAMPLVPGIVEDLRPGGAVISTQTRTGG